MLGVQRSQLAKICMCKRKVGDKAIGMHIKKNVEGCRDNIAKNQVNKVQQIYAVQASNNTINMTVSGKLCCVA